MSENNNRYPVALEVYVRTPTSGTMQVGIEMKATVEQFIGRVLTAMGTAGTAEHYLQTPLPAEEEGEVVWRTVGRSELLIDAVRGVQQPPRIIHESQIEGNYQ